MFTEIDEKNGLVKLSWKNVREKVHKVEPTFAKLVDELNPDDAFPVFLAYYPYGAIIADTISPFIPNMDGTSYRLSDPNIPEDIEKHLGYGKDGLPLMMVLDKHIEYFVDIFNENITIPSVMYNPGKICPLSVAIKQKSKRNYSPNGVLTTTAGARSAFMLPNIGCATHHMNLQREYSIYSKAPKLLYEQWTVFKEIINSKIIQSDWLCVVLYFSKNWIDKIHEDKAWLILRTYILELASERNEFERNIMYYDIIFSLILKKRNLKPNPYLTDTARHLFTIMLGAAPGYSPAIDDSAIPMDIIQKAYLEVYGLKKYPIIMQPKNYNFEEDLHPIYYSLQNPSTLSFSPKSRKTINTLFELRELEHLVNIFMEELSKENSAGTDTVLHEISKNMELHYFHNESDRHNIIKHSSTIISFDKNLNLIHKTNNDLSFPEDAKFLRGCISMNTKHNLK